MAVTITGRVWLLVSLGALFVMGCSRATGEGPSTTTDNSKPGKTITIKQGKDGRAKVEGVPLHGDPKTCAAFRKCCSSPDLGLMCGLTQASENGDCAKALAVVKAYAKESRSRGCK